MSFQAYIDNIKAKTGKSPEDFARLAEEKGFIENGELKKTVKAGEIVAWLKADFDLGHGHAMAIVATFKDIKKKSVVDGETKYSDEANPVKKPRK
jgi:hypothetical protein